jgi:Xaa-Pro aminopeptidase
MRIIKTEEEKIWLRKACQITAEGHLEGMKFTRPGVNERQIASVINHSFRMNGSVRDGYNPIVASGNSATTLHYNFNDQDCQNGDFVLIDMGAEYNHYTGDVTRTFPVNKRFSEPQKRFYQSVLDVQKEILKMIRPGLQFKDLQETAISLLSGQLLELGILTGSKEHVIEQARYKKYYPHGVSHWLGMDVHDIGLYRKDNKSRILEEGMCFTVEPGLYVPYDDSEAPKEFRGLGVRIEDNILVTSTGHENMTSFAPKEIADLESL